MDGGGGAPGSRVAGPGMSHPPVVHQEDGAGLQVQLHLVVGQGQAVLQGGQGGVVFPHPVTRHTGTAGVGC